MKEILLIITLLIATFIYNNAQTKSKSDRIKAANNAAGLSKDGTPRHEVKANKDAAKAKKVPPAAAPVPTFQTPVAPTPRVITQAPALVTPKAINRFKQSKLLLQLQIKYLGLMPKAEQFMRVQDVDIISLTVKAIRNT